MFTRLMTTTALVALATGGVLATQADRQSDGTHWLLSPAQAQETMQQPEMPEEQAAEPATPIDPEAVVPEQDDRQWLASEFLGQSVYNRDDEEIGSVDDLVIEEDGGITALVVGVGGFLGIGKKLVGVDLAAVDVERDEYDMPKLVIDGSREALEEAPGFVDKQTREAERQAEQARQQQQQTGTGTGAPTGLD